MSRGKTYFLAPYREEEDSAEETLLRDPPSDQRPPENQDIGSQNQRSDLADTFNLFKSYLNNKLESRKEELSCSGNDLENLTKLKLLRKKYLSILKTRAIKYSTTLNQNFWVI